MIAQPSNTFKLLVQIIKHYNILASIDIMQLLGCCLIFLLQE